jgi:spermidine synthase
MRHADDKPLYAILTDKEEGEGDGTADEARAGVTSVVADDRGGSAARNEAAHAAPDDSRDSPWRVLMAANALVFASSACIMIIELVAARLVAQNLGASLYTWTSVIGVILAGISIGNYIGGKIADRQVPRRILPLLFLASSFLSFSVLWLNHIVSQWGRPESFSWPSWVLFNVALVFLLPAVMLGTISPVVAKMALDECRKTGSTVGSIYAWAAIGSIFGTFLTGFFLIDTFGTRAIVLFVALGLALLGLLLAALQPRSGAPFIVFWLVLLVGCGILAFAPGAGIEQWGVFLLLRPDLDELDYYDESNYFAIQVYDAYDVDETKVLALDNLVHAYIPTDDITNLVYDYESVYAAITKRVARTDRSLRAFFIGGGGFVFPRYMEAVYPMARIDVAEIDPAVKAAAQAVLDLPPDGHTGVLTHTMDARNFVDDRLRLDEDSSDPVRYDFIYGDAFNDLSVPYHLTTREFNEKLESMLAPDGVYMINIIDIYREGLGRFLGAFVATALETFPYVYVFSSDSQGPTPDRDTFVVACGKRPLDLFQLGDRRGDLEFEGRMFAWSQAGVLGGEMDILLQRAGGLILTDDFAPVNVLLAPIYLEHY